MESGKINSVAGDSIARTLSDSVLAAGPAVVSRGYRIANIERLRILSAAAIVCFHTCGDLSIARHLGTVGILVFLISLCHRNQAKGTAVAHAVAFLVHGSSHPPVA
jgi:hypothetical protein